MLKYFFISLDLYPFSFSRFLKISFFNLGLNCWRVSLYNLISYKKYLAFFTQTLPFLSYSNFFFKFYFEGFFKKYRLVGRGFRVFLRKKIHAFFFKIGLSHLKYYFFSPYVLAKWFNRYNFQIFSFNKSIFRKTYLSIELILPTNPYTLKGINDLSLVLKKKKSKKMLQ